MSVLAEWAAMKTKIISTSSATIIAVTLASGFVTAQTSGDAGQKMHSNRPHAPSRMVSVPSGQTQFGDPLPGLTTSQLGLFGAGLDEFENVETPDGGLGPIFNDVSCVACHNSGGTGGASSINVTRFGLVTNGVFDPLESLGGSLLQDEAIDPAVLEVVPQGVNVVAQRQSTPLFGLGLIEAIADADIQANVPRQPVDGIKGRVAMVTDVATGQQRVGRFGWKAQQATLLSFAGDAYLNEMGVTSRLFPVENAPNGDTARLNLYDTVIDPEDEVDPATGKGDIDAAADFMRFLAPPTQLPLTTSAAAGKTLFQQINCAVCHKPLMTTAANPVGALNRKQVWLYSDLLLHDMGSLGDGIVQGPAGAREMRTPPLWGLRASAPYLHDGRAPSVDAAIRAHDGEAATSRDRYLKLNKTQRQQILDFLKSI